MESCRCVQMSYTVSGETLGILWQKPEHEWTTFVSALHYYAARKINVPIWCVDLLWECDPWDEAQLPMNVQVKCNISSVFPEIAESTASYGRCCNCWEDCEDLDDLTVTDGMRKYNLSKQDYCGRCGTTVLCDLCKVELIPPCRRGGSICCLWCVVPPRGYALWPGRMGYHAEAEEDYQARVAAVLAGLTEAQQKRWRLVSALGRGFEDDQLEGIEPIFRD
jgi:hypothetical protein